MVKRLIFITFAKVLIKILPIFNMGSGTALPGLIAEKYFPKLFEYYASQLKQVIVITGTNGKTTTKTILTSILHNAQRPHITNRSGSNLKRGILSTFISHSTLTGKLKTDMAVFEVEEATLPKITKVLKPNTFIITNLFRDQLDAYGEVNKTREYIKNAILSSPEATLILNLNDPMVASLSRETTNTVRYFQIEDKSINNIDFEGEVEDIQDIKIDECTKAQNIKVLDDLTTTFTIDKSNFHLNTIGIFHIYNALAAYIAAVNLGIDQEIINRSINNFKPAFGRGEMINYQLGNKQIEFQLLLIKNPAGFTLTLDTLTNLKNINLLIAINDKIADGRDISWLWDSKIEYLKVISPKKTVFTGTRAADMALRAKYALGLKNIPDKEIIPNPEDAIKYLVNTLENNSIVYVLPTYTTMNELRSILGKQMIKN